MSLNPKDEALLAEIRSKYGRDQHGQPGTGQHASGDPDDVRSTIQGNISDYGNFEEYGGSTGTIVQHPGTPGSSSGRSSAEPGESDAGVSEVAAAVEADRRPVEGYRAEGTGQPVPAKSNGLKIGKPQGMAPVPSSREERERPTVEVTGLVPIKKVVKEHPPKTKGSLGRVQVLLEGNKFAFLEYSDPRIIALGITPPDGSVVSPVPPAQKPPSSSQPRVNREAFLRPEPEGSVVSSTRGKTGDGKIVDSIKTARPSVASMMRVAKGTMTAKEAHEIKETYCEALDAIFELADKGMSATLKGHPKVVVWSDMDEEETGVIADAILILAQREERVAVIVRQTVNFHRHGRVIEIMAPRFIKTYQLYYQFGFEMPGGSKWRKKMVQVNRR